MPLMMGFFRRRISLRTILLTVSLLFLLLPLGSLYYLRIYQSALIRQTESELISQAAFVSALYKEALKNQLASHHVPLGRVGIPVAGNASGEPFEAIPATLDLATANVYPPRPIPYKTDEKLDPLVRQAGEQVQPVLQDAQRITMSGIKILDARGVVVAGPSEQGLSFAHAEEFQEALKNQPVKLIRVRRMPKDSMALGSVSRGSHYNVFVALPVILDNTLVGVVWVNRTPTDLAQALFAKRGELFWTALSLLGLTIIVTALTSYTIARPIQALVRQTQRIARGHETHIQPVAHPITREVAQLSESVVTMARKLQHRNEYIRNFAAHVSHEFKTPLTSIQGSTELLQDNWPDMPEAQRERFLSNIAEDTERLKRLVNRLLELAQADMAEPLNQHADLLSLLEHLKHRYQSKGVNVTLEGFNHPHRLRMTPESIEAVLTNLLENSRQAGATAVTLTGEPATETLTLRVQDNGPGISENNLKQVFTPFFTTQRQNGGTGMGLSISLALVERQGGTIRVVPSSQGACFELLLPTV